MLTINNAVHANKHAVFTDEEVLCKKYCTDSLLLLLNFSYREITILKLRLFCENTFKDIAYEMCISHQRVRIIYKRAINKILVAVNSKQAILEEEKITDENVVELDLIEIKEFKTKWVNILKQQKIYTLKDLSFCKQKDLLSINFLGRGTIKSIETILNKYGLALVG